MPATVSTLYTAAAVAAQAELPAASLALLERMDALNREHAAAGRPLPVPPELLQLRERAHGDDLVCAVISIRRLRDHALLEERHAAGR